MEGSNPYQGGAQYNQLHHEHQTMPAEEQVNAANRIYHGVTEALREGRSIDHATARAIAAQLHTGQDSALYALASSGAINEGLGPELDSLRSADTPVELEPRLDALDEYVDGRADDPGPVDGWSDLWPSHPPGRDDEPDTGEEEQPPYGTTACAIGQTAVTATLPAKQAEDNETEAHQALFERISAAGVTTLGQVATVRAPDQEPELDEPDPFPWDDAATWSPTRDRS